MIFEEIYFYCYIVLSDQIHLVAFTSWNIGQYVYCNFDVPHCDVLNFEIDLNFLSSRFFLKTKKSKQKFKYLENDLFRAFICAVSVLCVDSLHFATKIFSFSCFKSNFHAKRSHFQRVQNFCKHFVGTLRD